MYVRDELGLWMEDSAQPSTTMKTLGMKTLALTLTQP